MKTVIDAREPARRPTIVVSEQGLSWNTWLEERAAAGDDVHVVARRHDEHPGAFAKRARAAALREPIGRLVLVGDESWDGMAVAARWSLLRSVARAMASANGGEIFLSPVHAAESCERPMRAFAETVAAVFPAGIRVHFEPAREAPPSSQRTARPNREVRSAA